MNMVIIAWFGYGIGQQCLFLARLSGKNRELSIFIVLLMLLLIVIFWASRAYSYAFLTHVTYPRGKDLTEI